MAVIESILWIIFTLICILVSGVILLQEGKGGGLGEAFGGAGQQTFGVKAQGIAKFTGLMAGLLVVLALTISVIRSDTSVVMDATVPPLELPGTGAPADPGAGDASGTDGGDGQ